MVITLCFRLTLASCPPPPRSVYVYQSVSIWSQRMWCLYVLLRARPKAERVLLRIRENPEYERPAGRGHAFERLISLEPKARLASGLLWWVPPFLLPCMGPMPNHASTHCGTWRVLPGGMSQMFRLLFLGNGWADCIEIW